MIAQSDPKLCRKRQLETDSIEVSKVEPGTAMIVNKKLKNLQEKPLQNNIDFITLQSSLSLLKSNLSKLEKDIQQLSSFKSNIRETNSFKQAYNLINKNNDYLKEINYKGSCIKCPAIDWERNYGIDIKRLSIDQLKQYNEVIIDDSYEIIKRDKLFN